MVDVTDEAEDVAVEILDTLTREQAVELMTEMYFLLDTPERVELKGNIS